MVGHTIEAVAGTAAGARPVVEGNGVGAAAGTAGWAGKLAERRCSRAPADSVGPAAWLALDLAGMAVAGGTLGVGKMAAGAVLGLAGKMVAGGILGWIGAVVVPAWASREPQGRWSGRRWVQRGLRQLCRGVRWASGHGKQGTIIPRPHVPGSVDRVTLLVNRPYQGQSHGARERKNADNVGGV